MIALACLSSAFAAEPVQEEDAPAAPSAEAPTQAGPSAGAAAAATKWPIEYEGQCKPGDPHFDLEVMYYEGKYEEGVRVTSQRLQAAPDDVVLMWMKLRFMYEVGERFTPETEVDRVAHYKQMVELAERGLELDPGNLHHRFGRGVAMGRLGTTRGVLASLFMAKDVESDWLAVATHPTWRYSSLGGYELLPCDAYHALGIFYRLVPEWWILQVIAGTRGSLDKSESFHRKAVACKPQDIKNWKELAATQLCIGTKRKDDEMLAKGLRSIERGLKIRARSPKERVDHAHLALLREDPEMACGYSRDGQQDLDEKRLDKGK